MTTAAKADVKLPALISENMVVQQQIPVHLWGWADDGEKVTVSLGKQTGTTVAKNGKWSILLPPTNPAGGPYTLTITGKNQITFKNVLVGEVWVCSGQSNMQLPLSGAEGGATHIAASANPKIRLLNVKRTVAETPLDDTSGQWTVASPQTVGGWSAVAYFFARDLHKARGVPIGLIESDRGGSPAEAWTRESALTAHPRLKPLVDNYPAAKARYDKAVADYNTQMAKAKAEGTSEPRRVGAFWRPSELYNAMIAPLLPYRIRGVVWYQGESNGGTASAPLYRYLLPNLIESWRADWKQGDFPFLVVQLPAFRNPQPEPTDTDMWPVVREAQAYTAKTLPHVGMVVTTDVGERNNIHPVRKEPVGARLALLARRIVYGEKIVAQGPSFRELEIKNGAAVVRFDNTGSGLEARPTDSAGNPVPSGQLTGWAIAGADKKFVWADARITGSDTVTVSSPVVPHPVAVRFGWAEYPLVNLWNKDGFPASPFRTDTPTDAVGASK